VSNPSDQRESLSIEIWKKEKRNKRDRLIRTEPPPLYKNPFALRASLSSLKKILLKSPACIPFNLSFASRPGELACTFE
jgi:hypothetical protein